MLESTVVVVTGVVVVEVETVMPSLLIVEVRVSVTGKTEVIVEKVVWVVVVDGVTVATAVVVVDVAVCMPVTVTGSVTTAVVVVV